MNNLKRYRSRGQTYFQEQCGVEVSNAYEPSAVSQPFVIIASSI
jgi:hypothetical protein